MESINITHEQGLAVRAVSQRVHPFGLFDKSMLTSRQVPELQLDRQPERRTWPGADGKGPAAAIAVCAGMCEGWPSAGQSHGQYFQDTFTCTGGAGSCITRPISVGPNDTVIVELYGTGLRHLSSLSALSLQINGQNLPIQNVQYAGAQGMYKGLDQINVQIPPSLAGSGEVNVTLTLQDIVNGISTTSNTVTLNIH